MQLPDALTLKITLPDLEQPAEIDYVRADAPRYVYIPRTIWDGENVWDGVEDHGVYRSLEAALERWRKESMESDLVATEWEDPSSHPVPDPDEGKSWMVHEEGTEPDEEGHRWIFRRRLW